MLIGRYAAVLDACVLFGSFQRAALLWMARERLYRPIWSEAILDEWRRGFVRQRPELADRIEGIQAEVTDHFPSAMVGGVRLEFPDFKLPDPDDAHVLAAALVGRADAIITCNLKDFPANVAEALGLEAVHPDTFLVNLIDLDPVRAVGAFQLQRSNMSASTPTVLEFLDHFDRSNLVQARARLEDFKSLL